MHVSICSGIGGLDLAFGPPAAFWETADAPSQVLAARYPNVPNHGDWTELDRFDPATTMITAGLPCQEVSAAGRNRGEAGKRYLFDDFTRILAASDCRPTLVLENVRGWISKAHHEGFTRFTRSLATVCGYDLRWGIVRASDSGAPHQRARWFCLATHADTKRVGRQTWTGSGEGGTPQLWGHGPHDSGGTAAAVLPTPTASQPGGTVARFLERKTALINDGYERTVPTDLRMRAQHEALDVGQWGKYAQAIERWERILERPAPSPLTAGKVPGSEVLSPMFAEWMMGLPQGWITGLDMPRTRQLQCLGNAVVPQQAALAVNLLKEMQ